jgi:metallo-beta-lactamase class B
MDPSRRSAMREGGYDERMKHLSLTCLAAVILATVPSARQQPELAAVAPFKIGGNLYYVGTTDPAAYLFTTPAGHILVDTTYDRSAPFVADSIRALGFKLEDVEIILSSHAHLDHVGGHASMKKLTGAQVAATAQDAVNLESGGVKAFHQVGSFAPVTVDRRLKDGDTVQLGGTTLTAHLLPGHTEGNTAWTATVEENGRRFGVLIAPSMSINPGVRMVNNPTWPGVADAYASSFQRLRTMRCEIFLGPHAGFFDLAAKRKRQQAGAADAFVDPKGYVSFLDDLESKYRAQVERERAGR